MLSNPCSMCEIFYPSCRDCTSFKLLGMEATPSWWKRRRARREMTTGIVKVRGRLSSRTSCNLSFEFYGVSGRPFFEVLGEMLSCEERKPHEFMVLLKRFSSPYFITFQLSQPSSPSNISHEHTTPKMGISAAVRSVNADTTRVRRQKATKSQKSAEMPSEWTKRSGLIGPARQFIQR